MMRRIIGSPATGMAGFARTSVSGRRRVPSPAVRTSASRMRLVLEQHVGWGDAACFAVAQVNAAIRVEQVIGRPAPERFGGFVDAALASLDFDERSDRRLVDGHDDVVERELLAVLLISEPRAEAELPQN